MDNPFHDQIVKYMMERYYGQSLMANVWRGSYVEAMISLALGEGWNPLSEWDLWDLINDKGVRVEVKQSAALQTWTKDYGGVPTRPSFSIEPKYWHPDGYYMEERQRHADIYVFAWHSEANEDIADHRVAEQWQFYVVPEHLLPEGQKSISLNPVSELTEAVTYDRLAAKVEETASTILHKSDWSSAKKSRIRAQTFIDSFPDLEVRQAVKRLFDVSRSRGAKLRWTNRSATIHLRCKAWRQPVAVAWIYEPGAGGWDSKEGFHFGAGNFSPGFFESLPANLGSLLDNWLERLDRDGIGVRTEVTGIRTRAISHQAAADNIDLICDRLDRVLKELSELQPAAE